MSKKRRPPQIFNISRRRFLTGAAATGALAVAGCGPDTPETAASPGPGPVTGVLPNPADSGIDHIVQIMMENRSFDHMLGWVPGADGRQNQTFKHTDGTDVPTFHIGHGGDANYGFQGCGWEDPAHGYDDGREHYNDGKMDGFLKTVGATADKFPVGYYNADDLLFYKGVAEHFTICDRYFHGFLGSTFPNRIYMHAGATDRMNNAFYPGQDEMEPPTPASIPTIWDQLAAKGLTGKNYFSDLPITAFWANKYATITRPFEEFLLDAARGTLPNVSYFDPFFGASAGESPAGVSRDDHPQADVRDGQVYLTEIYNALRASPNWEKTLMIVTYDEWGGFYDHVAPPISPVSAAETALGNDGRLGFRTPCVILGPRARRKHVSHLQFDPNSVINLIRWRWGLDAVGDSPRNQTSLNMALALDFANPANPDAPEFGDLGPLGSGSSRAIPYGNLCTQAAGLPGIPSPFTAATISSRDKHMAELEPLARMARQYGLIR
ncbi:MAG: alkaline phosphatase family protein [Pseudomonadota bacterium]